MADVTPSNEKLKLRIARDRAAPMIFDFSSESSHSQQVALTDDTRQTASPAQHMFSTCPAVRHDTVSVAGLNLRADSEEFLKLNADLSALASLVSNLSESGERKEEEIAGLNVQLQSLESELASAHDKISSLGGAAHGVPAGSCSVSMKKKAPKETIRSKYTNLQAAFSVLVSIMKQIVEKKGRPTVNHNMTREFDALLTPLHPPRIAGPCAKAIALRPRVPYFKAMEEYNGNVIVKKFWFSLNGTEKMMKYTGTVKYEPNTVDAHTWSGCCFKIRYEDLDSELVNLDELKRLLAASAVVLADTSVPLYVKRERGVVATSAIVQEISSPRVRGLDKRPTKKIKFFDEIN